MFLRTAIVTRVTGIIVLRNCWINLAIAVCSFFWSSDISSSICWMFPFQSWTRVRSDWRSRSKISNFQCRHKCKWWLKHLHDRKFGGLNRWALCIGSISSRGDEAASEVIHCIWGQGWSSGSDSKAWEIKWACELRMCVVQERNRKSIANIVRFMYDLPSSFSESK